MVLLVCSVAVLVWSIALGRGLEYCIGEMFGVAVLVCSIALERGLD